MTDMNTTGDRGGAGMGSPFAEDREVWEQNSHGHLAMMYVSESLGAGAEVSRVTVMGCHEGVTSGPQSRETTASIRLAVTPDADPERLNIVQLLMAPDGARALVEELAVYADWAERYNEDLRERMRPSDGKRLTPHEAPKGATRRFRGRPRPASGGGPPPCRGMTWEGVAADARVRPQDGTARPRVPSPPGRRAGGSDPSKKRRGSFPNSVPIMPIMI